MSTPVSISIDSDGLLICVLTPFFFEEVEVVFHLLDGCGYVLLAGGVFADIAVAVLEEIESIDDQV
jgi:hypothetical protein